MVGDQINKRYKCRLPKITQRHCRNSHTNAMIHSPKGSSSLDRAVFLPLSVTSPQMNRKTSVQGHALTDGIPPEQHRPKTTRTCGTHCSAGVPHKTSLKKSWPIKCWLFSSVTSHWGRHHIGLLWEANLMIAEIIQFPPLLGTVCSENPIWLQYLASNSIICSKMDETTPSRIKPTTS